MIWRLFVALAPGVETRAALAAVAAGLERAAGPAAGGVRWARPEALHLTVRFLGEVEEARVEEVKAAVAGAAAAAPALRLEVGGAGAFPSSRRAGVVWLGLAGDLEGLARLGQDLDARLLLLGLPPRDHPLAPHLTVGRARAHRGVRGLEVALATAGAATPVRWRAGALTLFRSHLAAGGVRHEPLLVAPLGA